MRKSILILIFIAVLGIGWFVWSNNRSETPSGDKHTGSAFDTKQHSPDDPDSIWVVVNKRRPLQPASYQPTDLTVPDVPLRLTANDEEMQLRTVAAAAIEAMFAAAEDDGLHLMVSSAFRSYTYQDGLYNSYVRRQGQQEADTQSARPGHSEHQTGLAVDVEPANRACEVEQCFADLPEGKWVADNAYKHGFVIRYQKNQDAITGYIYEPWHLRYVGKPLAKELHARGNPTLEAFFGLPPAPDYQ